MELLGQRHVFSKILEDVPQLLFFGVVPIYISPPKFGASQVAQTIQNLLEMQETQVRFVGCKDPLKKKMATHSSILAWESHGQRSLVGYSSMESQRVRHN